MLGRGRPRQGGGVRDISSPFGAERGSSDDARDASASLPATRILRKSQVVVRIITEMIEDPRHEPAGLRQKGSGEASVCGEARGSSAILDRVEVLAYRGVLQEKT